MRATSLLGILLILLTSLPARADWDLNHGEHASGYISVCGYSDWDDADACRFGSVYEFCKVYANQVIGNAKANVTGADHDKIQCSIQEMGGSAWEQHNFSINQDYEVVYCPGNDVYDGKEGRCVSDDDDDSSNQCEEGEEFTVSLNWMWEPNTSKFYEFNGCEAVYKEDDYGVSIPYICSGDPLSCLYFFEYTGYKSDGTEDSIPGDKEPEEEEEPEPEPEDPKDPEDDFDDWWNCIGNPECNGEGGEGSSPPSPPPSGGGGGGSGGGSPPPPSGGGGGGSGGGSPPPPSGGGGGGSGGGSPPPPSGGGGGSGGGSPPPPSGGGGGGSGGDSPPPPSGGGGGSGGGSEDGQPGGAVSGSCTTGFTCNGDAVQCAIIEEQIRSRCTLEDAFSEEAVNTGIDYAHDQVKDDAPTNEIFNVADFFDNALNKARWMPTQCVPDDAFTALGVPLSLSWQPVCDMASYLAPLIVFVASMFFAVTVVNAIRN